MGEAVRRADHEGLERVPTGAALRSGRPLGVRSGDALGRAVTVRTWCGSCHIRAGGRFECHRRVGVGSLVVDVDLDHQGQFRIPGVGQGCLHQGDVSLFDPMPHELAGHRDREHVVDQRISADVLERGRPDGVADLFGQDLSGVLPDVGSVDCHVVRASSIQVIHSTSTSVDNDEIARNSAGTARRSNPDRSQVVTEPQLTTVTSVSGPIGGRER